MGGFFSALPFLPSFSEHGLKNTPTFVPKFRGNYENRHKTFRGNYDFLAKNRGQHDIS